MRWLAVLFSLFLVSPASAQIVNTLPFQLQNGTTADATQVMADFNQIVNNANANAAKNGANSDITSLSALTTPLTPAQGGSSVYVGGVSGGAANAQTVTVSPSGFTLAAGKRVVFLAGFTNTGPLTLATSGTTATNVYYPTPSGPLPLVGGEVKTGNLIEAVFDGTQYQLVTNNLALLGPLTNIASATTTDLGTVPTHNVNITGTTTITSFGATASTAYPIYYLTFAGVTTLTYNQTSCSTVGNCINTPGAANITTAAGDTAVAQYLGAGSGGGGNWLIWSYQRASGTAVVASTPLCGALNLQIVNDSGTPNTNIDYSADSAVMVNSSGASITSTSVSGVINTTNVGVINGIQASRANSQWYNIYFLSNGSTTGAFAVPAGTGLSAPSGYTYSCKLGAMLTNSSGNFFRSIQKGSWSQWQVLPASTTTAPPVLVSAANISYTAFAVSAGAPPSATDICVQGNNSTNSSNWGIAPNANYNAANGGAPLPPIAYVSTATYTAFLTGCMTLESSNLYAYSNTGTLTVYGLRWKDNVNAN